MTYAPTYAARFRIERFRSDTYGHLWRAYDAITGRTLYVGDRRKRAVTARGRAIEDAQRLDAYNAKQVQP